MGKRGFTLLEVILASLMLSVGVGAFFCSFLMGKETVGRAGRNSMAYFLTRDLINELKNAVDANYWPPFAPPTVEVTNPYGNLIAGNHTSDISTTPLGMTFSGTRQYDVDNVDLDLAVSSVDYKTITVKVHWNEP